MSRILFLGDVIGSPGRETLKKLLPKLLQQHQPDLVIINGENSAHGKGITQKIYDEFMEMGVQCITSGNHIFDNKEILKSLNQCPNLLRPINYPKRAPGTGMIVLPIVKNGLSIAVISVLGQVFMPPMNHPFEALETALETLATQDVKHIIVDIHAEATSEKVALLHHFNGRITAILGTHTHVQTADEIVTEQGTAYITDVGMVGAKWSLLGMEEGPVISRFLTGLPAAFQPEKKGPMLLNGVVITLDNNKPIATAIERISLTVDH